MKSSKHKGFAAASLTLTSVLFSVPSVANAATKMPAGMVRAEINGTPITAIAVGDTTYVKWLALKDFHTPNQYLGSGKFALTGGTVQGVIYHGDTYLPWAQVAPRVKATPLTGGGFNFTALPVTHDYQVGFAAPDGTVGSPDVFEIAVADGDNFIPNQTVQITFNGSSYASGYKGQTTISVTTGSDGTWTGAINDTVAETVGPVVSWTDPNGAVHSHQVPITFASSTATQPVVPSDDNVVATVPLTTFQNGLFFNAQGGGQDILFQLDTGAYEPLVTKQVAQLLNLPNLGSTQVQGIGGQDTAYNSQMTLSIGGQQFTNIPCIVDDSYNGPSLFGYGFFGDNGYDLLVSQKHNTITILK